MTHFPQVSTLPDAIFWDWDGTIVDSYQYLSDVHNYTLRTLGMDVLKEGEFKEYFGLERLYIFSTIYKDQMDEAVEIFQNRVMETNELIKPMEGIKDILEFLNNNDVKLGVVTNKRRCYVEQELKNMGLDDFLPIVVCSAEAARDKPFPDPLLLVIKQSGLNIQKHDIWYVGDTETDLLCAKNADCRSVFFGRT